MQKKMETGKSDAFRGLDNNFEDSAAKRMRVETASFSASHVAALRRRNGTELQEGSNQFFSVPSGQPSIYLHGVSPSTMPPHRDHYGTRQPMFSPTLPSCGMNLIPKERAYPENLPLHISIPKLPPVSLPWYPSSPESLSSGDVPTTSCDYSCLLKTPRLMENPQVTLSNIDLWRPFYQNGTEMIINKQGRLMFPSLEFKVSGLQADKLYVCLVDFVPVGSQPLKYIANQWLQLNQPFLLQMPLGSEQQEPKRFIKLPGVNADFPVIDGMVTGIHVKDCAFNRFYVHPDSPSKGHHWMQSPGVVFSRLKLTNSKDNPPNQVALQSMHLYQPRFHIIQVREDHTCIDRAVVSSTFPETRFVAVTSYQNPEITQLKVNFNKFARGYRTESVARTKQRQQEDRPPTRGRENSNLPRKPGVAGPATDSAVSNATTLMSILDDFQPISEQNDAAETSSSFADDFLAMLEGNSLC